MKVRKARVCMRVDESEESESLYECVTSAL